MRDNGVLMLDQHRRRGHFAAYAIIAAPRAIAWNRDTSPVAFDDIHLIARGGKWAPAQIPDILRRG